MLTRILQAVHHPVYRKRIAVLSELIIPHLHGGDRILDVGCGGGLLGHAILEHSNCPPAMEYIGLEKSPRGGEPIEVIAHAEGPLPFSDESFDAVILADVLHHEEDESGLLKECARVARRAIILKDHRASGWWSYRRICFLDWAANRPYNVRCLYHYHTQEAWHDLFQAAGLIVADEQPSIDLYPAGLNFLFGRELQYLAVLEKRRTASSKTR